MLVTAAASLAVAQLSLSGEESGGRWAASCSAASAIERILNRTLMTTWRCLGGRQEVLDLRSHLDGMLLMRPMACLGKDRELSVREFAI